MKTGNYGNGSISQRQDVRWVVVCSRDPVTGKAVRTYSYGKTKREALPKNRELLAKAKEFSAPSGLTVSHS